MSKKQSTGVSDNTAVENIHKNHRKRMDERFRKTGFEGWSEYEILEYMLYATIKQGDTSPLSHRLLEKFGTLQNVLESDMEGLMEIKGIGRESARLITTLREFVRHCTIYSANIPAKFDLDAEKTIRYIKNQFFDEKMECFIMICLDARDRLIKTEKLFTGTFDGASLNVTAISRAVVGCGAAKVIFAHNHPSGNDRASEEDIKTTEWLEDCMRICGVEMIEHVIVADKEVVLIKQKYNDIFQSKLKKSSMKRYSRKK